MRPARYALSRLTRPRRPGRAVDARQSKRRQAKPAAPNAKPAAWEVTPNDLGCLDAVRSLLAALNDAYASTRQIHDLVMEIPVLAARCAKRVGRSGPVDRPLLDSALTAIGNMGLESELLGLLEDLTTCRADLLEAREGSQAPAPAGRDDPES